MVVVAASKATEEIQHQISTRLLLHLQAQVLVHPRYTRTRWRILSLVLSPVRVLITATLLLHGCT